MKSKTYYAKYESCLSLFLKVDVHLKLCTLFNQALYFEVSINESTKYIVQESRLEKVKIDEILYKNMNAICLFLFKGQCWKSSFKTGD